MTEITLTCCDYCNCQKWHPNIGCSEGRDVDDQGNLVEMVDCLHFQPLACSHCGHTGQEVGLAWQHVGGYCDHRLIPQCINRLACWQRWERHQLAQIRR